MKFVDTCTIITGILSECPLFNENNLLDRYIVFYSIQTLEYMPSAPMSLYSNHQTLQKCEFRLDVQNIILGHILLQLKYIGLQLHFPNSLTKIPENQRMYVSPRLRLMSAHSKCQQFSVCFDLFQYNLEPGNWTMA